MASSVNSSPAVSRGPVIENYETYQIIYCVNYIFFYEVYFRINGVKGVRQILEQSFGKNDNLIDVSKPK